MRRRPTHPHGYAKFVGRVGALAVFLGVGTALGTPVAHADDNGSTASASSSAGGSGTSASSRSATRPKSTKPADRDVGARVSRAADESDDAPAGRGRPVTDRDEPDDDIPATDARYSTRN